jgi:type IV pilus assembly protein PilM
MMFGSRGKRLVGLDIGTSSIKAVVLKQSSKGFALENLGIEPLPPEVIVDRSILDATVVVDALTKLFNRSRIRDKDVAISMSGNAVIVKKIQIPHMTEQELRESIRWEAEQYIPFDIEDVDIDFAILEPGEDGRDMDVVLVAVKKDKINEYLGLVSQAGLKARVVDVDGFALENQYIVNYGIMPNETVALIDIGASLMNVVILADGRHALSRDIPVGGNTYTDAIQKELNVSFEQAEALKMGEEIEGISTRTVLDILNSVTEDMSMEIQRSFDFYWATSSKESIDKVVLTGGCALIPGIDAFLSSRLNMVVEVGNPFLSIPYSERRFSPEFMQQAAPLCAVAVGLAIRRAGDRSS